MNWWGFDFVQYDFPDLELYDVPLRRMVERVGNDINSRGVDTLVSISPFVLTPGYDHPDHNRTGEVARIISTAMSGSRRLILWVDGGQPSLLDERMKYAKEFYPSQVISREILEKVGEKYLVVR
jgi:hypothetical protein